LTCPMRQYYDQNIIAGKRWGLGFKEAFCGGRRALVDRVESGMKPFFASYSCSFGVCGLIGLPPGRMRFIRSGAARSGTGGQRLESVADLIAPRWLAAAALRDQFDGTMEQEGFAWPAQ
jgi:hypothetical protein